MVHDSVVALNPDPESNLGTARTPPAVQPHPSQHAHQSADSCLHTMALDQSSSPSSSSTPPLCLSTHLPEHTASLVACAQHSKYLLDRANIDTLLDKWSVNISSLEIVYDCFDTSLGLDLTGCAHCQLEQFWSVASTFVDLARVQN